MDWIKRNLLFVIGAVVALVLMGVAGWYCFSGAQNSSEQTAKLTEGYTELQRLKNLNPSHGEGKVNNIDLAKEQQKEAGKFLGKLGTRIQAIPALPEGTNIATKDFSSALQDTISDLQIQATNNSVILPPKYKFSFEKQAGLVKFADGTLQPLAIQLGEVKAICEVLNEAKINALESIRRERVPGSPDDQAGTPGDYVDFQSTTNELAVITPYEVTFRCFTPELAGVLAGFARSPYGLLVKAINSEPAPVSVVMETPVATPVYSQPAPLAAPRSYPGAAGPGGLPSVYSRLGNQGFSDPRYAARPTPIPQPVQPLAAVQPAKSSLQNFLVEKQLKITMLVHVVKLLPPQK